MPQHRQPECLSLSPRPQFYCVDTNPPWGDYGDVLVNGVDLERDIGRPARLLRTGPFMPPITFITYPRRCIVSEAFKSGLEKVFRDLRFTEAIKEVIVDIAWHTWSRTDSPQEYPPGEPGSYLKNRPHSPTAAAALGRVWEVNFSRGADSRLVREGSKSKIAIDHSSWAGADFFVTVPLRYPIYTVTETGRRFLEMEVGEWVSFEPMITVGTFVGSNLSYITPPGNDSCSAEPNQDDDAGEGGQSNLDDTIGQVMGNLNFLEQRTLLDEARRKQGENKGGKTESE